MSTTEALFSKLLREFKEASQGLKRRFEDWSADKQKEFIETVVLSESESEGQRIDPEMAELCIIEYINVMGRHGFTGNEGDIFNAPLPASRKLTASVDFNAADFSTFMEDARKALDDKPTWKHYFKLALGIYTVQILEKFKYDVTKPEIKEKINRVAIFVIPYAKSADGATYKPPIVYDFGSLQP
ncbi:hypothetical protein [Chitinophaga pinensis]|uniref:Uncharacterized protein n=1 Tax=Chitinophaga pinensis TaxID=79329 RepID=A0A5C6LVK7_9BACT|nr:hypothetical protein [Chitinophaga pinensis]TWW00667.1 hypothetical protein FEF09_09195 [Chitinophaga pinensis]